MWSEELKKIIKKNPEHAIKKFEKLMISGVFLFDGLLSPNRRKF
jgi:hypothetical protein